MNETEMIAVGALITITASAVALVIKQLQSRRLHNGESIQAYSENVEAHHE